MRCVWHRLSCRGRRAPLYALPRTRASVPPATTIAPPRPTARLGAPRVPVATHAAVVPLTVSTEVRAREFTRTSAPGNRYLDFLCLGTPLGKEAQRGSHEGGAAELHRPTARDGAALQTSRQVVEGANTSFISPHQLRNSSLHFLVE